jgi:hypothetical protein
MSASVELELDSRKRLPLARVVHGDRSRFRVTTLEGGEILLTPVVSLSERELAVLARPELVESIRRGVTQAKAGQGTHHEAGHFSKLLGDHGIDPHEPDEE